MPDEIDDLTFIISGKIDGLPSVSEDVTIEPQCPFSQTPFLYLCQKGAERADSVYAEDIIFSSESITSSGSSNTSSHNAMTMSQPPHNTYSGVANLSAEHLQSRVTRSGSMGSEQYSVNNLLTPTSPVSWFKAYMRRVYSVHVPGLSIYTFFFPRVK